MEREQLAKNKLLNTQLGAPSRDTKEFLYIESFSD